MALLHRMSSEAIKTELDLFTAPLTQHSVERSSYVEIAPLSAITDNGPIEFFIPGHGDNYLDLNNTLVHLRLKVTKRDGTDIANDAKVSLINYPVATIFSQVDVTLGERLISQSSATYPYRAIMECLLNYSEDTLKTQFSAGLFSKDTAGGSMESTDPSTGANKGLAARARYCAESREFHLLGPIHSDIFFQERLLLNAVDLRLKLTRAKDEFCLMSATDGDFSLKVLGATLFIKKVSVSPAVRLGHSQALLKGNALYPLQRITMKTFSIPVGSRICSQENLFLGPLPRYVVIGLVDHASNTGSLNKKPFNFQHFNAEYVALCQDGRQVPAKAFQPQFNNNISVREFYNLFLATGRHLKDLSLPIDRNDFAEGYTMYAFNLSPDDDTSGNLSVVSQGNLRLEMRFRTPLACTVSMIVYACSDSILEVNSRRQVLVDYY